MENKTCPVCETGTHQPWSLGNKYCEKHDVCISCGVPRKGLGHTPWGVRLGSFQCQPCEERERKERIAERQSKEIDHEYTSEVVCPHCGYEHGDSWEMSDGNYECPECNEPFDLERIVSVSYTTRKETP